MDKKDLKEMGRLECKHKNGFATEEDKDKLIELLLNEDKELE